MANLKFYCDAERCIECNACVTACKNENEVPWGVNRRRVVTIKDGEPGERSLSVLDVLPLGGKRRLAVVRCYDRTFVLGLGDREISAIAELDPVGPAEETPLIEAVREIRPSAKTVPNPC